MKEYNFIEIEKKWQKIWEESKVYKTENKVEGRPNYYVLEMLPYPSGKLHVGHARNYTIGDVVARFKKMNGYNVLHPFGWDSFGLPAENAAIENNAHPATWTKNNIDNVKRQIKLLGITYDWDREIATYTPEYYKWDQWFFKKMYEKGLAYKKKATVNWCPDCNTVLANEQVEDGKCWRHSKTDVIKKKLEQWFFKTTAYADELLEGHKELKGNWPEKVLTMQKNWIGKSFGTEVNFQVEKTGEKLPVFTTRIETLYGVTYCTIAPEHPMVDDILKENPSIKTEVIRMKNEDMIERTAEGKDKTGVFTGRYIINPINGEKIELWIANYVLMNYGTGAVMAVPCHDERDFAFAKKYNLPLKRVISPINKKTKQKILVKTKDMKEAFIGTGVLINSKEFNELTIKEAQKVIAEFIEKENFGKRTVKYKLKDWGVSRQRYWGAPIPAIYCDDCGLVMEKDENLPVLLPEDIDFNGIGNPLLTSNEFKNVSCPCCGKKAKRDTDTMDTFVDSSWYYLRYCDPKNKEFPFSKEIIDLWSPVDQYIGGIEHAVMHLLYARFFHKVLKDLGFVSTDEPFKRLLTQGMVLGPSYYSEIEKKYFYRNNVEIRESEAFSKKTGEKLITKIEKMSKSKNNGVDPEEMITKYGVDTTRLFLMFAAPPERELEWNENGVLGIHKFLIRLWRLVNENVKNMDFTKIQDYENLGKNEKNIIKKLNKTIKKVTDSMNNDCRFNTAIAANMELLNEIRNYIKNYENSSYSKKVLGEVLKKMIIMLAPFTPHYCQELWTIIGNKNELTEVKWIKYREELLVSDEVVIAVQVNGKLRGTLEVPKTSTKEELKKLSLSLPNVEKHLKGTTIIKVIVIPEKIVNIIVKHQ